MKKITSDDKMEAMKAGSLQSFCTGWAVGVGTALSFGWTLGPVGIGVVVIGAAACLASDTTYK